MFFVLLLLTLFLTIDAHAQWVDSSGNSLDRYRSYYIPKDGYGYRRPDGTIDTPPILPKREEPFPSHKPSSPPPQQTFRSYEEPYSVLTEKSPGRDYRSGSLLRDRVK
jgi:hypothetical protein